MLAGADLRARSTERRCSDRGCCGFAARTRLAVPTAFVDAVAFGNAAGDNAPSITRSARSTGGLFHDGAARPGPDTAKPPIRRRPAFQAGSVRTASHGRCDWRHGLVPRLAWNRSWGIPIRRALADSQPA